MGAVSRRSAGLLSRLVGLSPRRRVVVLGCVLGTAALVPVPGQKALFKIVIADHPMPDRATWLRGPAETRSSAERFRGVRPAGPGRRKETSLAGR